MKDQVIFNKVARHLLTQGRKSTRKSCKQQICAYRGGGGLKCAAGCLIPDSRYSKGLEGNIVLEKVVQEALRVPDSQLDLVRSLQYVHDYYNARSWKKRLAEVANNYNLNTKALDAF